MLLIRYNSKNVQIKILSNFRCHHPRHRVTCIPACVTRLPRATPHDVPGIRNDQRTLSRPVSLTHVQRSDGPHTRLSHIRSSHIAQRCHRLRALTPPGVRRCIRVLTPSTAEMCTYHGGRPEVPSTDKRLQ